MAQPVLARPAELGTDVRVVSLVPSATETLLAWGVVPVAVTRFCEHPELPPVGGTKDPDIDAIVALAPDLVVMCREENRRQDADALQAKGVAVHDIVPETVAEVEPALGSLAAALGFEHPPVPYGPVPAAEPLGLSAFVPIWRRPWMSMGGATYGSSVLNAIGVSNVFAGAWPGAELTDAERYPEVSLPEAAERRPDVVLLPSEPYPFKPRHHAELEAVAPVVPVDGQDLFWWGVRTPAALSRLRAAIGSAAGAAAGKMSP